MDTERCKSIDQISASKSHAAGLRRTRPTTTTEEEEEEVINSGNYSGKRRRFHHPPKNDQKNVVDLEIQTVNCREEVVSSTESGSNCDRLPSPNQELSLDLKAELRFEIETESETSMSSNDGFSNRETSSSSEICLDSQQMESSKNKPVASPSRRKPAPASIMPTEAEIEEFFSVAEKKEQQRFANRYNYDIVNDVPMDGRYQWVRLKP